jgi:predicted nucleic acid-binding protein
MIVLDTNVLSALMRQAADAKVVAWLDEQPRTSVWTTSITILEIRFGLRIMAAGKRRSLLLETFEAALEKMGHRIAPFDDAAATQAADLMASRQRKGRPVELRDTMIAGIVVARHATLATRNVVHFEDLSVPVVNPWLV